MDSIPESEVRNTIELLREAENQQAVIRSKKQEVLKNLKALGIKPENLKKEIATLQKLVEEENEKLARRIRKANESLKRINEEFERERMAYSE